jgi:general secretion pathway protein C
LKKVVSLANFAALALLSLVLAYWSWAWLAPPAAARAPAAADLAARTSSAAGLFGGVKQGAAVSGAVRLMGVVAASEGRRGHAVLRLDGKRTLAVLQGEELEPGLRLAEVHVDHIVLERNGARETLAWPEKNTK